MFDLMERDSSTGKAVCIYNNTIPWLVFECGSDSLKKIQIWTRELTPFTPGVPGEY